MMAATAFITGLLNTLFFPDALLGASGIVFMMILLVSITNIRNGEIPLTFLLVMLIYLSKEVFGIFEKNTVSEFAHIIGGVCGGAFGFIGAKVTTKEPEPETEEDEEEGEETEGEEEEEER